MSRGWKLAAEILKSQNLEMAEMCNSRLDVVGLTAGLWFSVLGLLFWVLDFGPPAVDLGSLVYSYPHLGVWNIAAIVARAFCSFPSGYHTVSDHVFQQSRHGVPHSHNVFCIARFTNNDTPQLRAQLQPFTPHWQHLGRSLSLWSPGLPFGCSSSCTSRVLG